MFPSSSTPKKTPTRHTEKNAATGPAPYSNSLPHPKEPSGLYDILVTDSDMLLAKKKFLKVSSTGEMEVEPNRIEFCIQITTSRTDLTLAKESIKKREDYILSCLKKHQIKDVNSSLIVKRMQEGDGEEEEHSEVKIVKDAEKQQRTNKDRLKLSKEICVVCESLLKYIQIYSICTEKLDRHVVLSQPAVRFTPDHIQSHT
jgi:hypothetical protein